MRAVVDTFVRTKFFSRQGTVQAQHANRRPDPEIPLGFSSDNHTHTKFSIGKFVPVRTGLFYHYSNRSMDSEILLSNIPKQIPTYLYRKEFERTVNYAARCTATIFQKILAAPIYDIPGEKSDQS